MSKIENLIKNFGFKGMPVVIQNQKNKSHKQLYTLPTLPPINVLETIS